jgi:hypothetical protein
MGRTVHFVEPVSDAMSTYLCKPDRWLRLDDPFEVLSGRAINGALDDLRSDLLGSDPVALERSLQPCITL